MKSLKSKAIGLFLSLVVIAIGCQLNEVVTVAVGAVVFCFFLSTFIDLDKAYPQYKKDDEVN